MQSTQISINWEISRKQIPIPTLSTNKFQFTGNTVTPSWGSFSSTEITIGGTTSASAPGTYETTFAPKDNWCWSDGTTDVKKVSWTIEAEQLSLPTQAETLTYTGSSQTPSWNGYDSSKMTLGGVTSGIDAGEYTATFTPKSGCTWSDGSTVAQSVKWTIGRASIATVPSQSGTLSYSGSAQSPSWSNYSSTQLTLSGTTSATNAGTYTVTFTPTSNYQWFDGSVVAKSVSWSIEVSGVTRPEFNGKLVYSGATQSPTWLNCDTESLVLSGDLSGCNAGEYTTRFTLKDGKVWEDTRTTEPLDIKWTIKPQVVTQLPSITTSLQYTGSELTPTWSGTFDPSFMAISGETSAIEAGHHIVTFALDENHVWADSIVSPDVQEVPCPTLAKELVFTGTELEPEWNNFNSTYTSKLGDTSGTHAGQYKITFGLDNAHVFKEAE